MSHCVVAFFGARKVCFPRRPKKNGRKNFSRPSKKRIHLLRISSWSFFRCYLVIQGTRRRFANVFMGARNCFSYKQFPLPQQHTANSSPSLLCSSSSLLFGHLPPKTNVKLTPTEEHDMDRMFKLPSTTFIGGKEKFLPLREILNRLETAYCNKIGVEFMFINSLEQCNWIRERFESPKAINYSNDEKRLILARLTRATGWVDVTPNFVDRPLILFFR